MKIRSTKTGLICAALLAGFTLASLTLPVSAQLVQSGTPDSSKLPEGSLIYVEDFDGFTADGTDKVLAKLDWTLSEGLTTSTMKLSVADGKLLVDNLDASSVDSYALIMDSDYLKNVCNADYTYEYEVTYLDAGNTSRYVSLLCNYDGKDNYNTVDMRIRGDGYNQVRKGSSWIWYNDTVCPIRATDSTAAITQLFGDKFDESGMLLKGKTITIRVETSIEKGPSVYVNNILVSDMQDHKDQWNTIDSYAICFKASKLIKAEIDNIRIWTGLSDQPLEVKTETPADAPASSAQTSDLAVIPALVSVLASGAAVLKLKKSK